MLADRLPPSAPPPAATLSSSFLPPPSPPARSPCRSVSIPFLCQGRPVSVPLLRPDRPIPVHLLRRGRHPSPPARSPPQVLVLVNPFSSTAIFCRIRPPFAASTADRSCGTALQIPTSKPRPSSTFGTLQAIIHGELKT
ncbi:hypothetical protein VPH35_083343 [Triticum aestivum]